MRQPLIAANWKMYKTPAEADIFLRAFLPLVQDDRRSEIVICPPFVDLTFVLQSVEGSRVRVAAQNMHFAEEGAYTGEVSTSMLTALGVTHVILGHSERRQYFAETDHMFYNKLVTALKHGLVPIVCIGEHLEERESKPTRFSPGRFLSPFSKSIPPNWLPWWSLMSRYGPSAPVKPPLLKWPPRLTWSSAVKWRALPAVLWPKACASSTEAA